jgi:hypothetical protein
MLPWQACWFGCGSIRAASLEAILVRYGGGMTVKLLERNDKSNLKVSDFKAGEIMQAGRGENVETGGLILL